MDDLLVAIVARDLQKFAQGMGQFTARTIAAAAIASIDRARAGKTYRHFKRGTEYTIISDSAHLQSASLIGDYTPLVIYRSKDDDTVWARPVNEFNERFREE